MQKFLIIQTAFIGDVVLATAVAEKLHAHYPDAQIDFLVRKGNERLLTAHPFIKNVLIWDKQAGKTRNLLALLGKIRAARYDEVINLQRFFSSGLLTAFSGAKSTRGFSTNPLAAFFKHTSPHYIGIAGKLHEIARNQQLIADITDTQAAKPRLYPSVADKQAVAQLVKSRYICCAPSSVWFTKQYPKEHWTTFLNQLPNDVTVYILGAQSDAILAEEMIAKSGNNQAHNLCGKLTYLESAALMEGALMNFVNDSAPMHFASAVNAPVTAIFCSTVPAFGFGPLSDTSIVIETPERMPCRPCGVHGRKKCPLIHFNCAYTIAPERLVAIVNER